MVALTGAMFMTAVLGFVVGREWDRCIKRYNDNIRRRREEAQRNRDAIKADRVKKAKEKSDKFVAYTYWNAPGGY